MFKHSTINGLLTRCTKKKVGTMFKRVLFVAIFFVGNKAIDVVPKYVDYINELISYDHVRTLISIFVTKRFFQQL